jgi:pimeloyl-ACP methyl ester carboxylesterase
MTLPGFGGPRQKHPIGRLGLPMSSLAVMCRDTIEHVKNSCSSSVPSSYVLIAHDWGSAVSHECLRRFPGLVSAAVFLDVGADLDRSSLWLAGRTYQWLLALTVFLPRFLANWLTRRVAKAARAPNPEIAVVDMNYMYLRFWLWILTSGRSDRETAFRPPAPLTQPTLFLYAAKSPFKFYTERYLDLVTKSGGKAIPVPGDHWFIARPALGKAVIDEHILPFLLSRL